MSGPGADPSSFSTIPAASRRRRSTSLSAEARGDILVRVDGHCVIAPDYIERCVAALQGSGAAMVGGAMRPQADGWLQEGIAAAMMSPLGAGPARFHVGGAATWVDTVYLGAYWTHLAREVGGYREDVGVNEDAEFAIRMRSGGGIRFDPSIRSTYTPRSTIKAVASQFYRYGRSRAATVRRHPSSLAPRQMAAPLLLRRIADPLAATGGGRLRGLVLVAGATKLVTRPRSAAGYTLAIPAMHLPWATGFIVGLVRGQLPAGLRRRPPPAPVVDRPRGLRRSSLTRRDADMTVAADAVPRSVSVVVTTRNDRPFIRDCVDSLLRQDVAIDELIVLDCGSTDGTAEVVSATDAIRLVRDVDPHDAIEVGRTLARATSSASPTGEPATGGARSGSASTRLAVMGRAVRRTG